MDYEQKYKEALEKARQLCAFPTSKPFISDLQDIFPELKESEDERIRTAIIGLIKEIKISLLKDLKIGINTLLGSKSKLLMLPKIIRISIPILGRR